MWIDTHCHPFAVAFDEDREAMLLRARAAGVSGMLVVGFSHETNRQALDFISNHEGCWAALGIHPCDVPELTEAELNFMREAALAGKIVAIGETGLDYHHMKSTPAEQEEAFRLQIRLAKELNLPVIVHSRDAAEDTLRILLDEAATKVIFHTFSYDYEFAQRVWNAGFYTSFSGVLTFPSAEALRDVCRRGPLDQFLIETDSPYLAPQAFRGQRNEIAHVSEVGKKMAELRGLSEEELAEMLMKNSQALGLF